MSLSKQQCRPEPTTSSATPRPLAFLDHCRGGSDAAVKTMTARQMEALQYVDNECAGIYSLKYVYKVLYRVD